MRAALCNLPNETLQNKEIMRRWRILLDLQTILLKTLLVFRSRIGERKNSAPVIQLLR
jgi:hypothetical protein